jgi:hypothetical protein
MKPLQMPFPDPTVRPSLRDLYLPLFSLRHPLVWSGALIMGIRPTVTVEMYSKWYSLFVVRVGYDEVTIEEFPFPDDLEFCGGNETPFLDHAPNPVVVARWALKNGFCVDDVAMETMIGRWEREYRETYGETYVEVPEPEEPTGPCATCGGKKYVPVVGLTDPELGQAINPCPDCVVRR